VINQNHVGTPNITPATQSRVLEAMAQLNYVPNMAGRNLRRQLTERICLVLTDIGRPYDNKLVQDIQKVADHHNHSLIITTIDTPERKTKVLKQLQSRVADGAIINHEDLEEAELQILVKAQIPLVIFSNRLTPAGFDVVRTNEGEASYSAVKYLLEKGHRRIGIITNFHQHPFQDVRLNSYRQALTDYGVPLDESLIVTGIDRPEAYIGAKKLLQLPDRPTAIFASSDRAAISAFWTIRDAGLQIPQDMAVIGVGNIPESHYTSPTLTTIGPVSLDFTEAANLLFSRIHDPSLKGQEHLINWELIIRGSA
jgi:DNA-binding LacI/PurR family transcriptional regulator